MPLPIVRGRLRFQHSTERAILTLGSALSLLTERVVQPIEGMHRAISHRWFAQMGPIAKPVRGAHDATASVVYGSIRVVASAVGTVLDATLALEAHTNETIQAWTTGLWGDQLGRHQNRLGVTMGFRDRDGTPVASGTDVGAATGHLIVLVHGLMATERCWGGDDSNPGVLHALVDHDALTPLTIRYNTGLRISDNGSQMSMMLEGLVASWPVDVESIALVGHSMGGLVIRSACESAQASGHDWVGYVKNIVTLSSPHNGAPLEKIVNATSWALNLTSETRPLADLLNRRSDGIKDLRFGAIGAEGSEDLDSDALVQDMLGGHPLPPGISHHFVAGVLTANPRHPIGVLMGDLMVGVGSSTGKGRLDPTNVVVLGGLRHVDMLRQPAVVDQVMRWVGAPD